MREDRAGLQRTGEPETLTAMKTTLEHLPAAKQRELARVVQILFEEFEDATALSTQPHKRKGRILKVVLELR